jgi:glycine C-acetyltransferase/8-amino-7-oxononanoate synthase
VNEIHERLQELKELGLYRRVRMISGPQGPRVVLDGKPVLLLCSNNYLGSPITRACARRRPTPRCAGASGREARAWSRAR